MTVFTCLPKIPVAAGSDPQDGKHPLVSGRSRPSPLQIIWYTPGDFIELHCLVQSGMVRSQVGAGIANWTLAELWDKAPLEVHAMPRNNGTKHKGLYLREPGWRYPS